MAFSSVYISFLEASPTTPSPPTPEPTTTTTSTSTSRSSPPSASTPISDLLPSLILRLRRVIDQQRIQRQRVRQDVVSDSRTTDIDRVERDGVAAFGCHFDGAESGVHLGGDGGDGTVEDGACR